MSAFEIHIDAWEDGAPIPAKFAFGKPGGDEPFAPSDNLNPCVKWSGAPEGTKSFAIVVVDPDVPSKPDDVNQEGKQVPADLPRVDFYHWILLNIPASVTSIGEGQVSSGITAKGKNFGPTPEGLTGVNDYTGWFAGDSDMEGQYGSYDGPCPPWNDSIPHHYHFQVFALDVESLNLEGTFDGRKAMEVLEPHVLAKAVHTGTYSMNPSVPA